MEENCSEPRASQLLKDLSKNPVDFLSSHQHESVDLEYKASFEYDLELSSCPLFQSHHEVVFNQEMAQVIYETIVAFANTYGGLLVLGVAEREALKPSQETLYRCRAEYPGKLPPCCQAENQSSLTIGDLNICGINKELESRGMNFDDFQRMLLQRFSLGSGKNARKNITFKPSSYPCSKEANSKLKKREIKIWPSEAVDLCIDEITSISLEDKSNGGQIVLGAAVVSPSDTPVYLKIDDSNSHNVKYVLPVRKSGRTDLEDDWQRMQHYIHKRFSSAVTAECIKDIFASALSEHLVKSNGDTPAYTDEQIIEVVKKYADEWMNLGYPYHLVEKYGKLIKNYTGNDNLWRSVSEENVTAFLLMVSLHFNAGWEKWTGRNNSNKIAVKAAFESFHTNYWRVRFRVLYVLQFMSWDNVERELVDQRHMPLSDKTVENIRKWVADKTVVQFLKNISTGDNRLLSEKASQVLTEIASLWNDTDAGESMPF